MYGFVLIAVLAVTGGIIAFIGDRLGTKVGKRKLTIFGLRPKHTSILVTIVTGILISASTLGVMALVSRDVQTALFGMDALKAELSSLSQSIADKNTELGTARTELENKNNEYTALSSKVKETSDKLASISTELTSVIGERNRIRQELMRVQAAYNLTKAEKEKEIAALQGVKAELDAKVIALNQDKTSLESDVDKLNELAVNLKRVFNDVKSGYIIYRAGEIISMDLVPGGEKRTDTEYALGQVLSALNLSITEKLGIDKNTQVLFVSKHDFDAAVDKIANASTDMIVEVIASGNTVASEPVIVDIEVIPKRLVYSAGTMVYSQIFTAPRSAQQAEEIVLAFMQNVKKLSIQQGIIPDPIEGKVITIEGTKYFETVKKVSQYQTSDGKVQLSAVTSNDIFTVGPLRIDIRVQAAP